jgi:hypothetical protein
MQNFYFLAEERKNNPKSLHFRYDRRTIFNQEPRNDSLSFYLDPL